MASSDEIRSSTTSPTTTLEPTTGLPPEWNDWVYENRNTISALSASFCSTVAGFPLDSVKYVSLKALDLVGVLYKVLPRLVRGADRIRVEIEQISVASETIFFRPRLC